MDLATLTATLAVHGLDIVHAFPAHTVAREPDLHWLHDDVRPVGIVVGNTRRLWPVFLDHRRRDAGLAAAPDPIEVHVERAIRDAIGPSGVATFAHATYGGAYRPFQRLAVAAGLAALAPSQLLIHREYGPWFALRAAILAPGTPPPLPPRVELPCACVEAGCVRLFERASTRPDDWRAWLAVRDACPIGRAYRYRDDQIAYHYTKDRRHLP